MNDPARIFQMPAAGEMFAAVDRLAHVLLAVADLCDPNIAINAFGMAFVWLAKQSTNATPEVLKSYIDQSWPITAGRAEAPAPATPVEPKS